MRRVEFDSIVVTGFGSIVPATKFQLDRGGINLIRGNNGAGKTTLFNALAWALYQLNLKGGKTTTVPTKPEYRPKGKGVWKGTRVAVTVFVDGVEYVIARHIKYTGKTFGYEGKSDLLVFCCESGTPELVTDTRGKGDTQEFVTSLLGIDGRTFTNSIMFPQRSKRFIEGTGEEKRQLLEELFDMTFVDDMRERANQRLIAKNMELVQEENAAEGFRRQASSLLDKADTAEDTLTQWDRVNNERIDDAAASVKNYADEIKHVESEITKGKARIKEIEDKHGNIEQQQKAEQNRKRALQDALEHLSACKVVRDGKKAAAARTLKSLEEEEDEVSAVRTKCPTCEGPLKATAIEAIKNNIRAKYDQLRTRQAAEDNAASIAEVAVVNASKAYDELLEGGSAASDALVATINLHGQLTAFVQNNENRIPPLRRHIADATDKLNRLREAKDRPVLDQQALRDQAKEAQALADGSATKVAAIRKDVEMLQWWIKTGTSAKGVKAYMFHAMLEDLNERANQYTHRMGLGVTFSVDLSKASAPFTTEVVKGGVDTEYTELSGGERQRIDIAMLFALHDLVSSAVDTNILIMDEVFEGLDEEGMEEAFDMIRTIDKTIYVISHSPRVDTLQTHQIHVRKVDNVTTIEG